MNNQTQLSTFKFENSSIRTIVINNEPWFIARDICEAINISNYRDAIEKLDDDEKGVALTDTLGGQQEMNIVSESGMYTLILRCREAVKKGSVPHRFRKWVTAEVLPQIRKTGQYSQNAQPNLPIAEPKIEMELTQSQWLRLASGWFALYNCLDTLEKIHRPLELLGSRHGSTAYTQATEYQTTLGVLQRLLVPMFEQFQVDPFEDAHYHKALQTLRNFKPRGLGGLVKI